MNMAFNAPLSPGRSMKYNLFQFKSHVLGVAPHLGTAKLSASHLFTILRRPLGALRHRFEDSFKARALRPVSRPRGFLITAAQPRRRGRPQGQCPRPV